VTVFHVMYGITSEGRPHRKEYMSLAFIMNWKQKLTEICLATGYIIQVFQYWRYSCALWTYPYVSSSSFQELTNQEHCQKMELSNCNICVWNSLKSAWTVMKSSFRISFIVWKGTFTHTLHPQFRDAPHSLKIFELGLETVLDMYVVFISLNLIVEAN
jgi:hypothetical protein